MSDPFFDLCLRARDSLALPAKGVSPSTLQNTPVAGDGSESDESVFSAETYEGSQKMLVAFAKDVLSKLEHVERVRAAQPYERICDPEAWPEMVLEEPMTPERWTLYRLWQIHESTHWPHTALTMADDKQNFHLIPERGQRVIKMALAFFTKGDAIVAKNINDNFGSEIAIPEAKLFFGRQNTMEGTHEVVYRVMVKTVVPDPDELNRLLHGVEEYNSIALKHNWMKQWMNDERPLSERLIAFTCAEGIMFSASFCIIFYFSRTGYIDDIRTLNRWIATDEGLHTFFGWTVYDMLDHKCATERVHEIVRGAVDAELAFVDQAIPPHRADEEFLIEDTEGGPSAGLIGLTNTCMREYVEYIADFICTKLGVPMLYGRGGQENPCSWMKEYALDVLENQFERPTTTYCQQQNDDPFAEEPDPAKWMNLAD